MGSNMTKKSVLADVLKSIVLAERRGMVEVTCRPISKTTLRFLRCMQKKGYLGTIELNENHRGDEAKIQLLGRINKCGIISPHFNIKRTSIEQTSTNLLPARQFGHVVLTTNKGVILHQDCLHRGMGGKILGYFF